MRRLLADHFSFSIILFLFVACSVIALGINAIFFHYPGNTYSPPETPWLFSLLGLIYAGTYFLYGKESGITKRAQELLYLLLIMALIIIGCISIQYTPFSPIDQAIVNWEKWMGIDLAEIIHWGATHPALYYKLWGFYDSIPLQMTYLPLLLILFGRFRRVHEYYFLLLLTAFIGYTFYYFFPTTAPASMIDSPFFTEAQRATGIKFTQIHAHTKPDTFKGGMIAFPSFHVIWAWLCAFLIRDWPIAFGLLFILNTVVMLSCVLLGWHYILDIFGSILVIILAHMIHQKRAKTTQP